MNDSDDFLLSFEEKQEKDLFLLLLLDVCIVVVKMIEWVRCLVVYDIVSFLEGEIFVGKMFVFVGDQKFEDSLYVLYYYDFICWIEGDDWVDLD